MQQLECSNSISSICYYFVYRLSSYSISNSNIFAHKNSKKINKLKKKGKKVTNEPIFLLIYAHS